MRRLRDEVDSPDPVTARQARALSVVRPMPASDRRMRRVLAALDRPESGARAARALRPAWIGLVLLGLATVAGATVGRGWIARELAAKPAPRLAAKPALKKDAPPVAGAPPAVAAQPLSDPASTPPISTPPTSISPISIIANSTPPISTPPAVTSPVSSSISIRHPARPVTAFSHRVRVPVALVSRAPSDPDPAVAVRAVPLDFENAVLVDAVNALRRDHYPGRAMMLLRYYLGHYPRAALAEEALALAIEAAEQTDPAEAARLGERYLARYPAGHYRRQAAPARAGTSDGN